MGGGFGWNLSRDPAPRFSSLCHMRRLGPNQLQLVLIEDNPADANLVEEALAEAQLDCNLRLLDDGVAALEFIRRI